MARWIKPSELPEKFHGQCWVVWKSWAGLPSEQIHKPKLCTVQNYYRGNFPEYWDDGYYRSLKEDEYRLIILDIPTAPTKEVWDGRE